METEATKTLSEIDTSLSLSADERACSEPGSRGSGAKARENGARVSAVADDGFLKGDVQVSGDGADGAMVIESRVVETEISVERSFVPANGSLVGGGGGGEGSVARDLSYSDEGRQDKVGNGVVKGSAAENGGEAGEKSVKIPVPVSKIGKRGSVTRSGRREHEANHDGEQDAVDAEDVVENDGQQEEGEDGEEVSDHKHGYQVGDFVWGNIRSHSWWPGRIYDPSDASEYARKHAQKGRLLVAYFGDGSFSWCNPSQLKPFAEDFKEMANQSDSKNFVNAVEKALDEISRPVELKMTCSCISLENRMGIVRPIALNAGIKQGVMVPKCDLSRLSIPDHEPAELLLTLRHIAKVASVTSILELTVLRSWLSAFYQAKQSPKLAIYHEALIIEGLEDKRNVVTDVNGFSGQVEVPGQGPSEEEWLSSPVHPGFGQTNQSLLHKCQGISEDKLYHRRKKKSVAELMEEDMVVDPNGSMVKDATRTGNLVSTSGKHRRKSTDEAPSQGVSDFTSLPGRKRGRKKRTKIPDSAKSAENKVPSYKNGGSEGEEGAKKDNVPVFKNHYSNAKEEIEKGSSRERKKSKYLSPPFTSPQWRVSISSSKKDLEAESVKISKVARIGERMTKVASQLGGSPPSVSCNDEMSQKKFSKEVNTGFVSPTFSSPLPPSEKKKINIDSVDINSSARKVLYEVQSAALNPLYLWGADTMSKFISGFRSAIYVWGSNYKMYHRRQPGRKRKSLSSGSGLLEKDLDQNDHEMPESKSQRTRNEKKAHAKSDKPKHKQGSGTSGKKTNDKEIRGEASTPVKPESNSKQTGMGKNEQAKPDKPKPKQSGEALKQKKIGKESQGEDFTPVMPESNYEHSENEKNEQAKSGRQKHKQARKKTIDKVAEGEACAPVGVALILTFPPAFSLPSKSELVILFSKFGPLNEKETDVFYNSFCARVVFVKTSDAEEAFSTSLKNSPFGPAKVNYRLRYPSSTSGAGEGNKKASSPCKDCGETPLSMSDSQPTAVDDEASGLHFIKHKLEMMTSMLESSDGNMLPEMQSKLQGEMKGLLEKVSTMSKPASS